MRNDWRDSIRNIRTTLEGDPFRHDLTYIRASHIAEQYYCEMKLEHELVSGEIATEAKREGTDLHYELLAMEKVKLEDFIKNLESSELSVVSLPLVGQIEELRIAGVPDAVIFQNAMPLLVIELKTTKGDLSRLFRDQAVQVQIYGLLLEHMGFDCSTLRLCVVRMKRDLRLTTKQKAIFPRLIFTSVIEGQTEELERALNNQIRIFTIDYSSRDIMKDIAWAKDYWLSLRQAIPTNIPGKCKVCEYNQKCESYET